jgi:hypothetical protein
VRCEKTDFRLDHALLLLLLLLRLLLLSLSQGSARIGLLRFSSTFLVGQSALALGLPNADCVELGDLTL